VVAWDWGKLAGGGIQACVCLLSLSLTLIQWLYVIDDLLVVLLSCVVSFMFMCGVPTMCVSVLRGMGGLK
jgi:hypothetical protein